ncbi:MAG TPA: hypothetical protein VI873_03340 [Candidatus Peribacteraceae bacterium]|nr:hypothetical protein [Candidatus Peribacteraceae bacterium]
MLWHAIIRGMKRFGIFPRLILAALFLSVLSVQILPQTADAATKPKVKPPAATFKP